MLPIIALIGRPNVGKSSLFNRLIRKNQAITHDMPGVTRDRIYGEMDEDGVRLAVVDTGGMLPDALEEDNAGIDRSVFDQAAEALEEADVVLFVVDGREGITGLDESVSERVRAAGKAILLVVNKIDGPEQEAKATADFHALGLEIAPVSAAHGFGLNSLRARIAELAQPFIEPVDEDEIAPERGLKICMLGRPNAGKSSLVNALIGQGRQIVSDVAGTTRDSVQITYDIDGRRYIFVDTAGVRRKANIQDNLEKLSVYRALASSRRADVTILVLDALEGLSRQDKRLIDFLALQRTPFFVAVNKIDLVPKGQLKGLRETYDEALRICPHVPTLYISALTGTGLGKVLSLAEDIRRECTIRIGTGALNRAMTEATTRHMPPVINRRRAKFYYMTQADDSPPTFVFFVNDAELVKPAYGRYLESQLRKLLGIRMAPLQAVFRSSHEKKEPERVLKTRAPRLGKSRQDMDARSAKGGGKHWVKAPVRPVGSPAGKPGAKSGPKSGKPAAPRKKG